jgi:hypothetical protein
MNDKPEKVKLDSKTEEWLEQHPEVNTTVALCQDCGLYYKASLGHSCKKKDKNSERVNSYKSLGFKAPDFVENQYGIKIYFGTKGNDDWCVEIPKELVQIKHPEYKCNKNVVNYLISEENALRIAEEYTLFAKHIKE